MRAVKSYIISKEYKTRKRRRLKITSLIITCLFLSIIFYNLRGGITNFARKTVSNLPSISNLLSKPVPQPEFAQPSPKHTVKQVTGEVKAVDAVAKTITLTKKVKDNVFETVVSVDEKTKITLDKGIKTFADVKVGSKVTVKFTEVGDKNVAKSIVIKPYLEDTKEVATPPAKDTRKEDAVSYIKRGTTYYNSGQYNKAISEYTKAIESDPKNVTAYRRRGMAHYKLEQHERAIFDYSKAIELNPKDSVAYHGRCVIYCELGQYSKAISDCTKAIELHPESDTYFSRGVAYYKLEQYKRAISDFRKSCDMGDKEGCEWVSFLNLKQRAQELPQQKPPLGKIDPDKLEGEINSALMNAGIRGVIAKVDDNLEVTLKGSVGSNYEKDRAFEIAKRFKEAKRIRDVIFVVEQ